MTNKEIEDLGFKNIGGKLLSSALQYFESTSTFKNKKVKVFMMYVPSKDDLNIFREEKIKNKFNRSRLFYGKIKSINELEVLVKQLNLNDE
jgi:hypothetical protein